MLYSMSKEQAIEVLQNAINAANLKGTYTLADIALIIQALQKVSELLEIISLEKK